MPMCGFIDPTGKKITVVAVNPNLESAIYDFDVTGKIVKSVRAMQTDAVVSYKNDSACRPRTALCSEASIGDNCCD